MSWLFSKRADILRVAPEMKYIFIEKYQVDSVSKLCVGCCAWRAAAGIPVSASSPTEPSATVPVRLQ